MNRVSDGIRNFEWDGLSRLTKITWATGKTTDFKYNALGQRCERIETDGSTVTKTYYLFDGIEAIDRRSGTTADTATIDRRYFSQGEQRKNSSSWNKFYYCRDHLGSVREVLPTQISIVPNYLRQQDKSSANSTELLQEFGRRSSANPFVLESVAS